MDIYLSQGILNYTNRNSGSLTVLSNRAQDKPSIYAKKKKEEEEALKT